MKSSSDHREGKTSRGMVGWLVVVLAWLAGGIAILYLLAFFLFGQNYGLQIGYALLLGWVHFLLRTLPEVTLNSSLIVTGIVCSALVIGLGHWFARSVISAANKLRTNALPLWRLRWSVCGYLGVWLVFLVGMAIVGVVHQVGWMASSDVPAIENGNVRYRHIHQQWMVIDLLKSAYRKDREERSNMRSFLSEELLYIDKRYGTSVFDITHFFVIENEESELEGILSFPRVRPLHFKWAAVLDLNGEKRSIDDEKELRAVLHKHRGRLVDVREFAELPE